jgi:leukotriene-A4 hydrolase
MWSVVERAAPRRFAALAGAALALSALACRSAAPAEPLVQPTMDPHSHSRPHEVRVAHARLDLELDFDQRRVHGRVALELVRQDARAPLVLDVQGLEILGVRGADGGERRFALSAEDARFGSALSIELAPDEREVEVAYRTGPRSKALQWLAPEQTHDRRAPFLFTQGQAVLTRTWIPLQDTPGVRMTYEARVRAPAGMSVVMSAQRLPPERAGSPVQRFRMEQPIPCYLIALACGALEFRPISWRCGIWAEPGLVESARAELEDTEAMIVAAERLFGPYRWERYDVLVLPPAFPYGGMENPRATFATPTILAGDKSLVSLVAHELAHSWSGNLVTNASWRDFWLNEGFTVYCEGRIMEEVFGAERAAMEQMLARDGLLTEMREMQPRDTVLHIDLEGRHPDDGFSGVPYEKGALFLRRIEELCGRAAFDAYLAGYFERHAFHSIDTQTFERDLEQHLLAAHPQARAAFDIEAWLRAPGLPEDAPVARSSALERVEGELARWQAGTPAAELATADWVTQQWLHFLERAGAAGLDAQRMAELDAAFGFTASRNSEIACTWLRLAIAARYAPADERLEEFLLEVGRRKFLKPLYAELARTPAGRTRAFEIYERARPRYHAVATDTLDALLR